MALTSVFQSRRVWLFRARVSIWNLSLGDLRRLPCSGGLKLSCCMELGTERPLGVLCKFESWNLATQALQPLPLPGILSPFPSQSLLSWSLLPRPPPLSPPPSPISLLDLTLASQTHPGRSEGTIGVTSKEQCDPVRPFPSPSSRRLPSLTSGSNCVFGKIG